MTSVSADSPSVDVVIVQYGSYRFLSDCLTSIERARVQPHRIWVVVNGIRDGSVDQVRREYPNVMVVVNPENAGYPRAANQGLRLSDARYVVLLNNDLTVDDNWLSPLVETAQAHPEAAIVQPKMLSAYDRGRFDYAAAAGGFVDGYGYPCARGRMFDTLEEDHGQYDDECELFWASGAALLIDRPAALRIGGFEEEFFIFHEESDLAWRFHLAGRTVWFSPRSVVYHFGSASFRETGESARLRLYMMHRNHLSMLIKNCGSRELRFRLPVRLLLEVLSWPFLAVSDSAELTEALRGFAWVVRHPGILRRLRHRAQAVRRYPDASYQHLMVRGILPLLYYLGRRKSFAQLERYPRAKPAPGDLPE